MYEIRVALVEDPLLRASLRRLYPELPAWARRWLITTPGRPFPLPPAYHHPAWDSEDAALKALETTCAVVNASNPPQAWSVFPRRNRNPRFYWAGPPRSEWGAPRSHPAADGHLQGLTIDNHGRPELLIFQGGTGETWIHYSYRDSPTIDWDLVQGDQELAHTSVSVGSDSSAGRLHTTGGNGFADGTSSQLILDAFTPTRTQVGWIYADSSTMLEADLITRWHGLRSHADRARIAAFWLGHEHPALAAAGLTVTTQGATRQGGQGRY
jgi:hypothetical protein